MDEKFILIESGKPLCSIVVSERASVTEKFSANDLQRTLLMMTNAMVKIVPEDRLVKGRKAILVSRCSSFPQAGEILEEENDTILIKTIDSDILLIGGNNRRSVLYVEHPPRRIRD